MLVRLALTVVAVFYSLEAVATAVVISATLTFVLTTFGARRKAHFTTRQFAASLGPSLVVTTTAMLPAVGIFWLLGAADVPDLIKLFLGGLASGSGWLIGLRLTRHAMWHEALLLTRRTADLLLLPVRRRLALPGPDFGKPN
jgi:hypothetical protein